jgi:hypothetical protein
MAFQGIGGPFNPDPLVGLPGSETEKPEPLPLLNRIKKVTDSPKKRFRRQQPDRPYYQHPFPEPRPVENPVTYDPVQKIVEFPLFREKVADRLLRHKRSDEEESFNSGIQVKIGTFSLLSVF